ncbi:DEAD/DEAH box helicase [Baekduia soli]|uniref:DEAD/DEAH box helicase n=1 Tax=Baekduia soli TaxID=496014 RepID=A0A5B8U7I9_9ACTN|nr:DEAD/DEAH box helicase [Baekduia soli]QEC49076.1 DEAD/DEAH box helicase [Baekduia soli]
MSSQSFADLGVSSAVSGALAKLGFTEPFAIQKLIIGDVLAGRDVLAKSPTGSGKTLAFGVPMLDRIDANAYGRPSALVLAPTRELASQIVDELYPLAHARALKITTVYGGVGINKQERDAVNSHIVVATPGRLEDLLQRGKLKLDHVCLLVLDEADRMLDMGFRPAVDRIVAKCPRERQTLFLSATLDGEAGRVAREYTSDAVAHEIAPDVDTIAAIAHRFVAVERDDRLDQLVRELRAERELTLVFVRTKHGADRLVKRLGHQGVKAVAMHGDKSQRQRERALSQFERGEIDTLVATDVAARGIDVRDISHVINFDPPEDGDTYTHRVGRTGRAGRTGGAITFVGSENARDVQKMAGELGILSEFGQSGLLRSERNGSKPERAAAAGGGGTRVARAGGQGGGASRGRSRSARSGGGSGGGSGRGSGRRSTSR